MTCPDTLDTIQMGAFIDLYLQKSEEVEEIENQVENVEKVEAYRIITLTCRHNLVALLGGDNTQQ